MQEKWGDISLKAKRIMEAQFISFKLKQFKFLHFKNSIEIIVDLRVVYLCLYNKVINYTFPFSCSFPLWFNLLFSTSVCNTFGVLGLIKYELFLPQLTEFIPIYKVSDTKILTQGIWRLLHFTLLDILQEWCCSEVSQ